MSNNCGIAETSHNTFNEFVSVLTPNKNKLLLLHANIRSLIKNHAQLEKIIRECPKTIHIIVLTEVNITDRTKQLFNIDNYEMHTELRGNRRGGGIIIYSHKSITFTPLTTKTSSFECLIGEVSISSDYKSYICAIYRPPNLNISNFIGELNKLLSEYPVNTNFLTCGDMNIDLNMSNTLTGSYQDMMASLGFSCCISQHTRIETSIRGTSKSCIDHIFIRDHASARVYSQMHYINAAVIRDPLADHFITALAITGMVVTKTNTNYKLDNRRVRQELAKVDWGPVFEIKNPNDIYNFIVSKFTRVYESCKIQVKKPKITKNKHECQWLTEKLLQMSHTKNKLLQLHLKNTNDKQMELLYKKYRNKTNRLMNKARNNYTKREICNNFTNPKKMWQIINKLTGRVLQAVDDMLIRYFKMKTSEMTNKFARDFENNVLNILNTCNVPLLDENSYINTPNVTLKLNKISERSMSTIIKNINENKSAGYDNLRAKDIKCITQEITPVLTHLTNQCIAYSSYPDKLKIGLIRPIHKKGNYSDTNNYRPITILSSLDKIIEKYLGNQINGFLSRNGIIHERQFGFQKGKNTSQLLAQFTDEVNGHLNNRNHVIVVMIDFSKAFDTLNHDTLFKKLEQNGIQGPFLNWFKDYHHNRYNTVSIAGDLSDLKKSNYGTAQGSIIGPTEYLIYVNDMCNIFRTASVYQFADDTCLITANKDIKVAESQMQTEFDALCKWAHDAGLSLNYKKTKIMYIHSPYVKTTYTPRIVAHDHVCMHTGPTYCNCEKLEVVDQHTYLGLKIDTKFNWGPHVEHVCNKLRAILSNLSILKHKMPYSVLRLLYIALADSVINYGISSYGRTYKTYLQKIYDIQIRLLKTIVPLKIKLQYKNNYHKLFKYCRISSVYDKVKLAVILEYKHLLGQLDRYRRPSHLRTLTNEPYFKITKSNNEYGKRLWPTYLPNILNSLPKQVVETLEKHPDKIKSTLKKALIN